MFSLQTRRCDDMNFYGCYGAMERTQVFAQAPHHKPTRKWVPCGFRTATGFDAVRSQLRDLKCDSVVYTGELLAPHVHHAVKPPTFLQTLQHTGNTMTQPVVMENPL